MIKLFKKDKSCDIVSPVNGYCLSIGDVKDNMFAERMLGDGVALMLTEGTLYSPCDGTIIMIADTKHAIGIKTKNGEELLIHIGLDTVNLNGSGFTVLVKEGQKVKTGEEIVNIDLTFMQEKQIDLTTPMIITNTKDFDLVIDDNKQVKVGETIIKTIRK